MTIVLVQTKYPDAAGLGQGPQAGRLWERLRRRLPWALAAVLLPEGFAWLGRSAGVRAAENAASDALAPLLPRGWRVRARVGAEPVSPCAVGLADGWLHALPVRRGWVRDPIEWGWSTARDLAGGIAQRWVHPRFRQAHAWGRAPAMRVRSMRDPVATPGGDPAGGQAVAWACRLALRVPWYPRATTGPLAGFEASVAARLGGAPPAEPRCDLPRAWIDAAVRCLLDERLRRFAQLSSARSPARACPPRACPPCACPTPR